MLAENGPRLKGEVQLPFWIFPVLLLGGLLRLYQLGAESFWIDEVITARLTTQDLQVILAEMQTGRPPVYLLFVHYWIRVFGSSEVLARCLSAFLGILALPVMYIVGRKLFGTKVGVLGTLLMALSEFQIYHSQELRYYSLLVLFSLLSTYFFIRALRQRTKMAFTLYLLTSVLAYYTHPFALLVVAAHDLYFVLRWRHLREARLGWMACQIFLLLSVAGSLLYNIDRTTMGTVEVMNWIPERPIWYPLVTAFAFTFSEHILYSPTIFVTALVTSAIGIVYFVFRKGLRPWFHSWLNLPGRFLAQSDGLLLSVCWVVCPVGILLVMSWVFGPVYLNRYAIGASPALYLLLAVAIQAANQVIPEKIVITVLAILIVPGLYAYYATDIKSQWREAVQFLDQNANKDDAVLLYDSGKKRQFSSFDWYYRGSLPVCNVGPGFGRDDSPIDRCVGEGNRFWLLTRGRGKKLEELIAFLSERYNRNIHLVARSDFNKVTVRLYQTAAR